MVERGESLLERSEDCGVLVRYAKNLRVHPLDIDNYDLCGDPDRMLLLKKQMQSRV